MLSINENVSTNDHILPVVPIDGSTESTDAAATAGTSTSAAADTQDLVPVVADADAGNDSNIATVVLTETTVAVAGDQSNDVPTAMTDSAAATAPTDATAAVAAAAAAAVAALIDTPVDTSTDNTTNGTTTDTMNNNDPANVVVEVQVPVEMTTTTDIPSAMIKTEETLVSPSTATFLYQPFPIPVIPGNVELSNAIYKYATDDAELLLQHQQAYENAILEKSLSSGASGSNDKTSKQLSYDEWNRRVYLLRFWDGGDGILSQQQFRKKYVVGYKIRSLGFRVLSKHEFEAIHPGMLVDKKYYSTQPSSISSSTVAYDPDTPDYRKNEDYCIVKVNPNAKETDTKKYLLAIHQLETFEAIRRIHIKLNHSRITPTLNVIKSLYWNITEEQIKFFCTTCPVCHGKGIPSSASNNNNNAGANAIAALGRKEIMKANTISTASYNAAAVSSGGGVSTTAPLVAPSAYEMVVGALGSNNNDNASTALSKGINGSSDEILNLVTSMQQQQTEMMNTIQSMVLKLHKIETDMLTMKEQTVVVAENEENKDEENDNEVGEDDDEEDVDEEEDEDDGDVDEDDKPLVRTTRKGTSKRGKKKGGKFTTTKKASATVVSTKKTTTTTGTSLPSTRKAAAAAGTSIIEKQEENLKSDTIKTRSSGVETTTVATTTTSTATKRKIEESTTTNTAATTTTATEVKKSNDSAGSQRTKKRMITSRAASAKAAAIKEEELDEDVTGEPNVDSHSV